MSSGALFLGVSDEGVAFCDANKVLFPRLSFLCASCCPWGVLVEDWGSGVDPVAQARPDDHCWCLPAGHHPLKL